MKFIKYPSIEQLRNVVKKVKTRSEYLQVKYPVVEFNGTVKLHGTNGGIGDFLKLISYYFATISGKHIWNVYRFIMG